MAGDDAREPNEDEGIPPPSGGDAPSPEPDASPADPAGDDDLEELAEEDETKNTSAPVNVPATTTDGTDSESNAPASAPLNPFGFGRQSSTPFSGVIPSFGDASAAVGKRPFDATQVANAASETPDKEDNAPHPVPPPRKSVGGIARSFLGAPSASAVAKSPPMEQTKKVPFGGIQPPFTFSKSVADNSDKPSSPEPTKKIVLGSGASPFTFGQSTADNNKPPSAEQTKKVGFGSSASPFTFGKPVTDDNNKPLSAEQTEKVTFGSSASPFSFGKSAVTGKNKPTFGGSSEQSGSKSPFADTKSTPFGSVFTKPSAPEESSAKPTKPPVFGGTPPGEAKSSLFVASSKSLPEKPTEEAPPKRATYAAPIAPPKSILKKNYMQVPLSSAASMSKTASISQSDAPNAPKSSPSPFAATFGTSSSKPSPSPFGTSSDKGSKSVLFGEDTAAKPDEETKPAAIVDSSSAPSKPSSFGASSLFPPSPFATSTGFGASTSSQPESQPEKKSSTASPFGSAFANNAPSFGSFGSQPKPPVTFGSASAASTATDSQGDKLFGGSSGQLDNTTQTKSPFATTSFGTTPFSTTATFGSLATHGEKKSFGSAPVESAPTADTNTKSEATSVPDVPKLFTGKTPTFGTAFGPGSSPTKKVATPLFGTVLQGMKQNNPVVFSKRPSFQAALSPSAPSFVPGATAHQESSAKPVLFGSIMPEKKSESIQIAKPELPKPVATSKPEEPSQTKESPGSMKVSDMKPTTEVKKMEVSKEPKKFVKLEDKKEWNHVFSGVNILIFTPSATAGKKGNVQKKDGFFKLEVFKDNRGVRVEVVRLDTPVEVTIFSWEVGVNVLKVNRLKGRQDHAALTRIGGAAPAVPNENDPVKIFAMFVSNDDCSKFLSIVNNREEHGKSVMPSNATPVAVSSRPVPEIATKSQVSASDEKVTLPEQEAKMEPSSASVPAIKDESKEPIVVSEKKGMEHSRKEAKREKKDNEMEVDKPTQSAPTSKVDSKAALAAKKKLLLQRMNLAKTMKAAAKKASGTAGPSEGPTKKDGSGSTKNVPVRGFNPAGKEGDASPKVALSAVVGTKRSAKGALDSEAAKKQKVNEEPVKRKLVPEQKLSGTEMEALKNLKKQLAEMTQQLEKERAKAHAVERSLRAEVTKKNGEVRKLQEKTMSLASEKAKDMKKQEETANKVAYELAGLAEDLKKSVNGDKLLDIDSEALFACRPQSRDDFFKRLWTFKPDTWVAFSEIGVLDPVECALHGWHNDGVNRLSSSDGATIVMDETKYFNAKQCSAEVKRVRRAVTGGAHSLLGGWRGNRCPDEFRTAMLHDGDKAWEKRKVNGVVEITCNWCKRRSVVPEGESDNVVGERYAHCGMVNK